MANSSFTLCIQEKNLPSVSLLWWPDSEVNPIVPFAIALDKQLVVILLAVISRIEQDSGIAYRLLHASAADIHGATRQMVA